MHLQSNEREKKKNLNTTRIHVLSLSHILSLLVVLSIVVIVTCAMSMFVLHLRFLVRALTAATAHPPVRPVILFPSSSKTHIRLFLLGHLPRATAHTPTRTLQQRGTGKFLSPQVHFCFLLCAARAYEDDGCCSRIRVLAPETSQMANLLRQATDLLPTIVVQGRVRMITCCLFHVRRKCLSLPRALRLSLSPPFTNTSHSWPIHPACPPASRAD